MNTTTNYSFNLPESSDYYDVDDYNNNFTEIDTQLKSQADHISNEISNVSGVHGLRVNNNVLEAYVNNAWVPLSVNNAKNNYIVTSNSSSGKTNVNNISNNSVRLNLHDSESVLSSKLLKGSGSTTVTTDSNSNIVINTNIPTYSLNSGSLGDGVGIKLSRSDGNYSKVYFDSTNNNIVSVVTTDDTVYLRPEIIDPESFVAGGQIVFDGIAANGSVDINVVVSCFPSNSVLIPVVSLGSLRDTSTFSCCTYGNNGNSFRVRLRSKSSSNITDPITVNCIVFNTTPTVNNFYASNQ